MAWKFLNIGKANAEIDRLEAEIAALKTAVQAAQPPASAQSQAPDKVAALEKRIDDLAASVAALGENIATIEKSASDSFKVEIARLDKSFADFQTNAKELSTRLAAEITAAQGQPPLKSGAAGPNGKDILAEYNAIKDPLAQTKWYRENKAAYDAAWTAANRK